MRSTRRLFFLIFFIILFSFVLSRSCPPCGKVTNSQHPRCGVLRNVTGCELVRRPCSCCVACARNLGEPCSGRSPRCARGLMCVNGRGEALEIVPWHMKHYRGVCQNVVVRPVVVENLEVDDRRIGSDHDASRV